jgi:hypothetical protein
MGTNSNLYDTSNLAKHHILPHEIVQARKVSWSRIGSKKKILPPSQNISKNGSTKINVSELNFAPNTLTFVDHFLLIF